MSLQKSFPILVCVLAFGVPFALQYSNYAGFLNVHIAFADDGGDGGGDGGSGDSGGDAGGDAGGDSGGDAGGDGGDSAGDAGGDAGDTSGDAGGDAGEPGGDAGGDAGEDGPGPGPGPDAPGDVPGGDNPPPPPPPPPALRCVSLTASATTLPIGGGPVTLSWVTENATSASINGIGPVTPIAAGSVTTTVTSNTTFTLTVTGADAADTCVVSVTVTSPTGGGPACVSLTVSPTTLPSGGGQVTLSWVTRDATSASIDQGIGNITPVASGSTTLNVTGDTTWTLTVAGAASSATCTASVDVEGGDTPPGGGGGGGGGGRNRPNVILASVPSQPLAYLYLSQIPYTGLDLGPWGIALYWTALVAWSAALAYLVLFGAVPFAGRRMKHFGARVAEVLNEREESTYAAAPEPAPVSNYAHEEMQDAPRGYSSFDGFKSFAQGGALSIDDIVKGLSRSSQAAAPRAVQKPNVEPVYDKVEPVYENVEPIAAPAAVPVAPEVPQFLTSLVAGNREACFAALRATAMSGASTEDFFTQVACALDDAYRARTEGTPVNPQVKQITANIATPVLEKLVTAFSTAVDSSYSVGITGAKLALTRALATLGA